MVIQFSYVKKIQHKKQPDIFKNVIRTHIFSFRGVLNPTGPQMESAKSKSVMIRVRRGEVGCFFVLFFKWGKKICFLNGTKTIRKISIKSNRSSKDVILGLWEVCQNWTKKTDRLRPASRRSLWSIFKLQKTYDIDFITACPKG